MTQGDPGLAALDGFLAQPPPREGIERFLVEARQRRAAGARRLVLALLALGAVALVIGATAGAGKPGGPKPLILAMSGWLGFAMMVGFPVWVYLSRELSWGRRLLQTGTATPAEVLSAAARSPGVSALSLAWTKHGKTEPLTFRVPLALPDAQALVGSSLLLVHHGFASTAGLWLPGKGIITTR
jgi:hypothetical protein